MKTTITGLVMIGLLAGIFVPELRAQNKGLGFYLDIGYMNITDAPRWMTLGGEMELRFSKLLSLNPEVFLWIRDFRGENLKFVPGATLNLNFRHFLVGGGVIRRISDWVTQTEADIVPKVHFGYRSDFAKFMLVFIPSVTDDSFLLGLNVAFEL